MPKAIYLHRSMCRDCSFWAFVDKSSSEFGCWLWAGNIDRDGYGNVYYVDDFGVKHQRAHRVSWLLTGGHLKPDDCILHNCDAMYSVRDKSYRRCVNPGHLRVGTPLDNVTDTFAKKRQLIHSGASHWTRSKGDRLPRGENHVNSKLSTTAVLDILSSALTVRELSHKHNVSRATIENVKNRKIWRHVV